MMRISLPLICLILTLAPGIAFSKDASGSRVVRDVIEAYSSQMGGNLNLLEIDSMRVEGEYSRFDRSWKFILLKKPPQYCRFIVKQARGDLVMVTDGITVHQKLPFESEFSQLSNPQKANFLRMATTLSPLWTAYSRSQASVEYRGTDYVGSKECHVITAPTSDLGNVTFYVDKKSLLLIRLEQRFDDAEEAYYTVNYSDYVETEGRLFPHRIEVFEGDYLTETLLIEKITTDVGLLPSLFTPTIAGE